MPKPAAESGFRPVGEPVTVQENRHPKTGHLFWSVARQDMEFVDRTSGRVKGEGAMFYGEMTPGSLIVAVRGDSQTGSTLLVPVERYTTNLVEGQPTPHHYELPGGGMDEAKSKSVILETAERELAQEAGYGAEDFLIVGNPHRGLMPHPSLTDQNLTVLAKGAYPLPGTEVHEQDESEAIGAPEWLTWDQTDNMSMDPTGYWTKSGLKVISSAPTVASLNIAQKYLRREEVVAASQRTIIDLGAQAAGAHIQPPLQ